MESVFTLHNITMTDNREIAPGLFVAIDSAGTARIHNGNIFLGYTRNDHHSKRTGKAFGVHVWGDGEPRQSLARNTGWKTFAGARRALIAYALKFNR
jgi:hypothetical protein